jgi:hypothetical protein
MLFHDVMSLAFCAIGVVFVLQLIGEHFGWW